MKRNDSQPYQDALLKTETQQAIQRAVHSLPEDSLSLSWRSNLNERLRQVRPQSLWRSRFAVAWRPALGLALATSLALVMTFRTQPHAIPQSDASLEASLVATYDDSANSEVLAGPGLALHEVSDTTQKHDTSSDWTDSDLSSL
jgi:hypothetical protein